MRHGTWRSNAVDSYIIPDPTITTGVANVFATYLQFPLLWCLVVSLRGASKLVLVHSFSVNQACTCILVHINVTKLQGCMVCIPHKVSMIASVSQCAVTIAKQCQYATHVNNLNAMQQPSEGRQSNEASHVKCCVCACTVSYVLLMQILVYYYGQLCRLVINILMLLKK